MTSLNPDKRWASLAVSGLLTSSSLIFISLWLLSYSFYTSFGIDMDRVDGHAVTSTYYRIRYPGNGSIWLGGGDYHHPVAEKPIEPFDLGGVFLQPPRRPAEQSFWNQIGFWWVYEGWEQPPVSETSASANPHQVFIGVPSWLPVLLTGAFPSLQWLKRQRRSLPKTGYRGP